MPARLGQHFLANKNVALKIITALELREGDVVVEIGPGRGALTFPLLRHAAEQQCKKVILVERDKKLADAIAEKTMDAVIPVKIVMGDAIQILPKLIAKENTEHLKIVGNIPYYITGKLLRVLSELPEAPARTVLTIQREVAERLTRTAPRFNLLAAITQWWAEPEIIALVPPGDFSPPPNVESAVVRFLPRTQVRAGRAAAYYRLAKIAFRQPRKTLVNNLRAGLPTGQAGVIQPRDRILAAIEKIPLSANARPQDLSVESLTVLADTLRS